MIVAWTKMNENFFPEILTMVSVETWNFYSQNSKVFNHYQKSMENMSIHKKYKWQKSSWNYTLCSVLKACFYVWNFVIVYEIRYASISSTERGQNLSLFNCLQKIDHGMTGAKKVFLDDFALNFLRQRTNGIVRLDPWNAASAIYRTFWLEGSFSIEMLLFGPLWQFHTFKQSRCFNA